MYDLKVEVVEIQGFCDQPMHVGDYFELRGGQIHLPPGQPFCLWALQSVIPLLPAKQRETKEPNDWLQHTSRVICPDPHGGVVLEIQRISADEEDEDATAAEPKNPPKRLLVSEEECTGCRRCELACSFEKTGQYSGDAALITVKKDDVAQLDNPAVCRQCGNAPCVDSCPVGALKRDPDTHAVLVDDELCTGCRICAEACPFDAIKFTGGGLPLICDLCGGEPACVEACPTGAIQFARAGDRKKTNTARAMLGKMKGEENEGTDS